MSEKKKEEPKKKPEVPTSLGGRKVKVMHLVKGLDLIGSRSTISSGKADMTVMPDGSVHCYSKETGREVVIGSGNYLGYELLPK